MVCGGDGCIAPVDQPAVTSALSHLPPTCKQAQMVEQAAKKFVCIVDDSKLVSGLGGSKGERPVGGGQGVSPWTAAALAGGALA